MTHTPLANIELFSSSTLWNAGPLIWPLMILSLLGFIFFIERTVFLHRGQIKAEVFVDGLKNLLRKHRLLEALTVCEETPGPAASVAKAALLHYDKSPEQIRSAMQTAAIVEIPSLERRIGTIAAVAKVAPLLGLLGTVVAMLEGFYTMSEADSYATASSFSSLIAQALISTAAGLLIAVMAHLAYHFLHGRVRAVVHDMEWVGNELMEFLLKSLPVEEKGESTGMEPLQKPQRGQE